MANRSQPSAPLRAITAVALVAGVVCWWLADTASSRPATAPIPEGHGTPVAWSSRPLPMADAGSHATRPPQEAAVGTAPAATAKPPTVPEALTRLVETAPQRDLPALFRRLVSHGDAAGAADLRHRVLERLCEADPSRAAGLAMRLPAGEARDAALDMIAAALANRDPDAAILWAEGFQDGKIRLLAQIAYEISGDRPMDALGIAADLPDGPVRDDLIRHASLQWAAIAPGDAATWACGLTNPGLREQVAGAVATAWAASQPGDAARFVLDVMPAGRPRDVALIGIVQRWAQQQPGDAGAWVDAFPDGELKQSALESLAQLAPP